MEVNIKLYIATLTQIRDEHKERRSEYTGDESLPYVQYHDGATDMLDVVIKDLTKIIGG